MLTKVARLSLPLVGLMFLFGCEQPVKWSMDPKVTPSPVKKAQKFTATCKVTGDMKEVDQVKAIPTVAPEFTMDMKDDGKNGDEKASDGVFSVTGNVPNEAEPGQYDIEFVVYGKKGDPIKVPGTEKDDKGKPKLVDLSKVITVTVE